MNRRRKRIVVALGGNALGNTPDEQIRQVRFAAEIIADLAAEGHELIIGHGNGPQVGIINSAMNYAATSGPRTPYMPFPECGAMSQGFIGYHLQQALQQSLLKRNLGKTVVSVVTQVLVDRQDAAFRNPTKPIGNFYTREEADRLEKEKGYIFMEDAGRGYRRVVASPMPRRIVEIDQVKQLWDHSIVITCGGGGVPVVENPDGTLEGVAAVIDKDFAAELLAQQVGADVLMILTEVEKVAINWGKPNQQNLDHISLYQAARYVEEGHFAPGSMLPKIEAAMKFVRDNPDKKAIITSLDKAIEALEGKTGTVVTFA